MIGSADPLYLYLPALIHPLLPIQMAGEEFPIHRAISTKDLTLPPRHLVVPSVGRIPRSQCLHLGTAAGR
jgi:hypothetical protein